MNANLMFLTLVFMLGISFEAQSMSGCTPVDNQCIDGKVNQCLLCPPYEEASCGPTQVNCPHVAKDYQPESETKLKYGWDEDGNPFVLGAEQIDHK